MIAQEMSSFAALSEDYGREVLKDEGELWLIAHELSHQWWGNMVTCRDWRRFWLNEGMATFMAAAYQEHRFGRAKYLKEIEKSRVRYEKVTTIEFQKSVEETMGRDLSEFFAKWVSGDSTPAL